MGEFMEYTPPPPQSGSLFHMHNGDVLRCDRYERFRDTTGAVLFYMLHRDPPDFTGRVLSQSLMGQWSDVPELSPTVAFVVFPQGLHYITHLEIAPNEGRTP